MTRAEILATWDVDPDMGVIRSPGKFEGEMLYVPYFWNALLDGGADDDDGEIAHFDVSEVDRKEFPELIGIRSVELCESEQGFVCCDTFPEE